MPTQSKPIESEKPAGADVAALTEAVLELLAVVRVQGAPALWTVEDIAKWMNLSLSSVYRKVVTKPDFPKAVCPSEQRQWFAEEVVQWTRSQLASESTPRRGRPRNNQGASAPA